MRSLRREPALLLALLAVAALVLLFIVYPQLQVVLTPGPGGYVQFFQEGTWFIPLRNSVQLTLLSTTTAVLLGFVYAYAMVYSNMRWKPFFRLIGILPLLSPPFVVAAAYTLLFGARGVISYGVFGQSPNIYGLNGVWGVQTIAFFPFAYQLIADALSRSDPRMEQAARNLGAGSWRVFRTVVRNDLRSRVVHAEAAGERRRQPRLLCRVPRACRLDPSRVRQPRCECAHAAFSEQPPVHDRALPIRVERNERRRTSKHARLQRHRRRVLGDIRAFRWMAGPAWHVAW